MEGKKGRTISYRPVNRYPTSRGGMRCNRGAISRRNSIRPGGELKFDDAADKERALSGYRGKIEISGGRGETPLEK